MARTGARLQRERDGGGETKAFGRYRFRKAPGIEGGTSGLCVFAGGYSGPVEWRSSKIPGMSGRSPGNMARATLAFPSHTDGMPFARASCSRMFRTLESGVSHWYSSVSRQPIRAAAVTGRGSAWDGRGATSKSSDRISWEQFVLSTGFFFFFS